MTQQEQVSLNEVKSIFNSINNYLESNNSIQFIAPHINFDTLKKIGFDEKHHSIYDESIKQYKKNENQIQIKLQTEKIGRKSMVKNPLIKCHVYKYCIANSEYQHERILK